jgi:hypothetical protein
MAKNKEKKTVHCDGDNSLLHICRTAFALLFGETIAGGDAYRTI